VTSPPCASVKFEVAANGTPPLHYQWEKDGVAIPGAESSSLNVEKVTPMDEGAYRVVVMNSVSSVTSQVAVLTVTNPPPPQILVDSLQRLPDGRFRFLFEGAAANSVVEVFGSTDFGDWTLRGSFTNGLHPIEFIDPRTNLTQQFYLLFRRCSD
jgi:hypothetical protein